MRKPLNGNSENGLDKEAENSGKRQKKKNAYTNIEDK